MDYLDTSWDLGDWGSIDYSDPWAGGFTDVGASYIPDTSWLDSYISQPIDLPSFNAPDPVSGITGVGVSTEPYVDPETGQVYGGGSLPLGAGGGIGNLAGNPWVNMLAGIAGPAAGLIGALASGGMGPKPVMSTPQKAALNQAYGANQTLGQFALGQTPLQQQQASMLSALASGQIPQGYIDLVARAYDEQYQNIARRATEAGRQAGFYDSPMTSPVGGAIVGPAGAALQSQQAGTLLDLMTKLPGLYNTPIQTAAQAAGQQATGFTNVGRSYPAQEQTPLGPTVGQGIGNLITGGAQGYSNAINQQQNQQWQNSLLNAIRSQGSNTSLSYQPYDFSQTYSS